MNIIREAHAQVGGLFCSFYYQMQMFTCDSLWYIVRATTPTELCLLLAARDTVQPKQNRINAHTFTFDEIYQRASLACFVIDLLEIVGFHAHLNKKGDRIIGCDKDTAFVVGDEFFRSSNSTAVLQAFERLRALKLIWPTNTRATQRNFRPYYLQPTLWNLKDCLNGIQEKMPALVMNWIKKSSDE